MTQADTLSRLRSRRAGGLLLLSALLPGSAQFVAGNRRVGRWALRIWGLLLLALLVAGAGLLFFRSATVGFLLTDRVASSLQVLAWLVFASWVLLLVDAWRLGHPPQLRRRMRLALTAASFGLVAVAGLGTSVVASAFTAVDIGAQVFEGGGDAEPDERGRYNILLLGVDAADGRHGLRPDSINVASVDEQTGRTVLFGLPRNLQRVEFPPSSPLRTLYPRGYRCEDGQCMLNGIYTLGHDNAEIYPQDGSDPGIRAMKEAISHTLGMPINYYVMVDMAGFSDLVDAMGGIRVNVNKAVPIGGVTHPVTGYIGPGEDLHLDGYEALWLARSRHGSSDYERMVRQKCVMNAMVQQLDPLNVATKFVDLSRAGANVVSTDIGPGHVAELVDLGLKAKDLPMNSVNYVPPMIVAADPDFDLIRDHVATTIAESRALDDESPRAQPAPSATTPQSPAPTTAGPTGGPNPQTATEEEPAPTASPAPEAVEADVEADVEAEVGAEYGGNPELVDVCSVG